MKPPRSIHSIDVPSVEDVVPGDTERFVRLLLGDELAQRFDQDDPDRIALYCDTVRLMISTAYTMGAVDGEDCAAVRFPDGLMGLSGMEIRLILEGLVAAGRFVRSDRGGYWLSREQLVALQPGSERTH